MKLKIKYIGRAMELFGLKEKEETIYLPDNAIYKDAIEILKKKFAETNRSNIDIFNEVVIFTSDGRILKNIENQPIDTKEIRIGYLIAGG
jgi:hypothetical protein